MGHQATIKHIRIAANTIVKAENPEREKWLNSQWARQWFTRNKAWYKTIRAKTLSFERKNSHKKEDIEQHFKDFEEAIIKYRIDPNDLYNMDETGFRIGCINGRIVITHISTKAVFLSDPDNRDYITSVETICATGEDKIPPMLILKGTVMLESFFRNNLDPNTLFAATPSGFIDQNYGLYWIQHFDKFSKIGQKGEYRMLVTDGHNSHINEDFLVYCWMHKIIPFLLPAHSTHLPSAFGCRHV